MQDKLDKLIEDYKVNEGNLISILQKLQQIAGYLPKESINYLSDKLNIPASKFYGLATFYAQFYLKQRGKNIITACCGTACHVKGSAFLIDYTLKNACNIPNGEDTSTDHLFTVQKVACVGACSIAPVVIVNEQVHGKVTSDKIVKEIDRLKEGQ
jgi:NADH:ubiquinone oxidoreductase subunit E